MIIHKKQNKCIALLYMYSCVWQFNLTIIFTLHIYFRLVWGKVLYCVRYPHMGPVSMYPYHQYVFSSDTTDYFSQNLYIHKHRMCTVTHQYGLSCVSTKVPSVYLHIKKHYIYKVSHSYVISCVWLTFLSAFMFIHTHHICKVSHQYVFSYDW